MTRRDAPIPILSFKRLPPGEFARTLGISLRNFGFAIVTDHGMSPGLIEQARKMIERLFGLPKARSS